MRVWTSKVFQMATALALIGAVPVAAAGRHRERNNSLCSLKTVFVSGESQSAVVVRRELAKRTWLKPEDDQSRADATFDVQEKRTAEAASIGGQAVTVTGSVRQGQRLLWSDSVGGPGSFVSASAKATAWQLLKHLDKDAGCR